jgi:hypothetical protein
MDMEQALEIEAFMFIKMDGNANDTNLLIFRNRKKIPGF